VPKLCPYKLNRGGGPARDGIILDCDVPLSRGLLWKFILKCRCGVCARAIYFLSSPRNHRRWEQGTTPAKSPCALTCSMIAAVSSPWEQGTTPPRQTPIHTSMYITGLRLSHILFVKSGCSLFPMQKSSAIIEQVWAQGGCSQTGKGLFPVPKEDY